MDFEIKQMSAEYAEEFGYVIYTAWGETYRGLMPDSILDDRSMKRWADLAKNNPDNKYIALKDGKVIGVLGFLPQARDFVTDKNSAEIVCLYVLQAYQKQGVGKALINAAFENIKHSNITLFVLKGNENAIGFYKKMGFEFTGKEITEGEADNSMTEFEMSLKR